MMIQRRVFALILGLLMLAGAATAGATQSNDVVLHCWVYYNGVQEQVFDAMVKEFNATVGNEQGVFVEYSSKSTIPELSEKLKAAALEEPGAEKMPDIFAAYSDTALTMYNLGAVADISPYLTEGELDEYIDAYVEEGRMGLDKGLYIFPTAKATEMLVLNQTAWNDFQAATGADIAKLSTWEGIVELGRMYYEWTDGLTPETPDDGQAFYGRDAVANYLLVGAKQLGGEVFQSQGEKTVVTLDRDIMRKLWDCYYVPYMSGWFTAEGRYRSDDIKTGRIIALVGSSSGSMYFPEKVTQDDGTSKPIECGVYPLPNFEGSQELWSVQQGAGLVVSSSTPERERAAVTFLRWFTEPKRNIEFCISSGYLPVTKAANNRVLVDKLLDEAGTNAVVRQIITTGVDIAAQYQLYAGKPFDEGYAARQALERGMMTAAAEGSAQRRALMEAGATYDEAVAQLNTDEIFEQWYQAMKQTLEQIVGE